MSLIIRNVNQEDLYQLALLYEQFWGKKSDIEKMSSEYKVIAKENRHIILVADKKIIKVIRKNYSKQKRNTNLISIPST
ncbi:MAG TPA: hypothetical protein GXX20_10770 [Clostridiaceae bacterium]|nr:hypothetical protein [Clostridiaceae bacterium]